MEKRIQLFLLPYAGGSTFSFMKTLRFLDKRIEAIPIEYAGRGSRKNESFITLYDEFIEDVVRIIREKRKKRIPYALLGYSMGTAILFDMVSEGLLSETPQYCFFCAGGSLIASDPSRKYSQLLDEDFKKKIINLGGIDGRILQDEKILVEYLQLIKADHDILAQYQYNNKTISVDSHIIYSPDDITCVHMNDWNKIITGNVQYYQLPDGHFFINQHYAELAEIINNVYMEGKGNDCKYSIDPCGTINSL